MFKSDFEIPRYSTAIGLSEDGNLLFRDISTGKAFTLIDILEREVKCNGISYSEISYKQFFPGWIHITTERGIVYRILLHSYDYKIVDIGSIKLDSVGETICEYFNKPINEEAGRLIINLDVHNETASYHEFVVENLVFINTRKKEEWKGSNFESCILKMLQEIHQSITYNEQMNEMHGLYPPRKRNLRIGYE